MTRLATIIWTLALGAVSASTTQHLAVAQPAKGAPAAFERVREVMANRLRDLKLTGDPDKDFAAMLMAHHEDMIYLAKTQLEYGGDRQLRQLAQSVSEEGQKEIDLVKEWQVRSRQADYKAQPDQSPPGSGPLDLKGRPPQSAQMPPSPAAESSPTQPQPAAAPASLPLVRGTIENVDVAQGKVTIEHGPIPNLSMDGMTMVFRAADPMMIKSVKKGDKVQFTADRVNGQLTVTKIQKGR